MSGLSWQDAFNLLGGVVLTVGGWVLRSIWDALQELRKLILDMEKDLPRTYARRDDTRDMFNQILNMLKDINTKLDGKADKD